MYLSIHFPINKKYQTTVLESITKGNLRNKDLRNKF
mgnify:CR=1 FL=1